MKYIYKHGNQFWYQRAVPDSIYKIIGIKSIKISLKTNKVSTAIKRSKIQALEHKKMFKYYEKKSKSYIKKIFSKSTNDIKKYEINFLDDFDDLVSKLVFSKAKYLNDLKANLELRNQEKGSLENFLFTNVHDQFPLLSETTKFLNHNNFYVKNRNTIKPLIIELLRVCDDKLISEYNEDDSKKIYEYYSKTNNIQYGKKITKNLSDFFVFLFRHYGLNKKVFLKNIRWNDNINTVREFSVIELDSIKKSCLNQNDVLSFFIAMMFNTGCSYNELIGLETDDVKLDEISPFLIIRSNSFRNIGNINKIRTIPLVGISLWGAKNIFSNNKSLVLKKFKDKNLKIVLNESSINKRIKTFSNKKTISSFKYSLIKRLIQVECPEEVILEIIGKSKKNRLYSQEISLELKASWLKLIVS